MDMLTAKQRGRWPTFIGTNSRGLVIRILLRISAIYVVSGADGLHQFGIEGGLFPGLDGGVFEGVVVVVSLVAPVVALEVVPEVFDWIEFRAVRRQRHEGDVLRYAEFFGDVEAGSVPNHHRLFFRRQRAGELSQEFVDDLRVELRA